MDDTFIDVIYPKIINDKITNIVDIAIPVIMTKGNTSNVLINMPKTIEISLDCNKCKRQHRTVVFGKDGTSHCCGSTGHEGYPGQILSLNTLLMKKNNLLLSMYSIGINWNGSFIDSKYGGESNKKSPCKHSWGRIYFSVQCRKCKKKSFKDSVQNNSTQRKKVFISCEHVKCEMHEQTRHQSSNLPWIRQRKVMITHDILNEILQQSLLDILPKGVVDILVSYSTGYW